MVVTIGKDVGTDKASHFRCSSDLTGAVGVADGSGIAAHQAADAAAANIAVDFAGAVRPGNFTGEEISFGTIGEDVGSDQATHIGLAGDLAGAVGLVHGAGIGAHQAANVGVAVNSSGAVRPEYLACQRTAFTATGIKVIASNQTACVFIATDIAGAERIVDAAAIPAHQTADGIVAVDRGGTVGMLDVTLVVTHQAAGAVPVVPGNACHGPRG